MRKDKSLIRYLPSLLLIFSLLIASVPALAQSGDRAVRAAQWDGYQLPAGKFTRFVDRQKGFSFRIPADWKQSPWSNGGTIFKPASEVANLIALTEEIAEGSGVANYVSGVMQSFRNEPIKPESATVRRVISGGLEWREIAHEIEGQNGVNVRQTMWFTAVGSRAYGLALSVQNGEIETYEPIFKRVIASVRIGAAGHWDEEFETLRAAFTAGSNSETSEIEAATVAEALRAGRESLATAAGRIAELLAKSPDAAIDLITDADPQARTATIIALGRSMHPQAVDLLVWALSDKDLFASSAAAQALAARGAQGQSAIKSKLAALAENPSTIVRAGVAMGESASRELIEELLRSDGAKQHVAALRLALTLEKFDLRLPYSKLLASTDPGAPHTLVAVLQRHRPAEAANEIIRFLRTDDELWAARALGEIGSAGAARELNKRIAEIDARLEKLGKVVNKTTAPKKGRKKSNDKRGDKKDDSPETFSLVTVAEFRTKPEDVRLAMLRGQLDTAARKIKFRERWNQARTEAERRAVKSEINKEHDDLAEWAELSLTVASPTPASVANLDLAKLPNLKDAPATGETLFPKNTFSYAMAPDFAATMDKIDSALSGVQMATVRDQMTFALILKALKAALASKLGVDATGDASKAAGIDLKSPIALASWQSTNGGNGGGATHSAVTVRVADRARFERLLATYQESLGDFDQFFTMAAAMSRFAGIIPAAVPAIYASIASDEARGIAKRVRSSTESKIPSLKPFAHARQESVNGTPVTVLIKPVISEAGGARWEKIFIAYLGDTAVVSPSREAIADLLAAGTSGETIARSEAFAKAVAQSGEIVFFSRLNDLLKPLFDLAESKDETDQIAAFVKAFGVESGALQLTQHSWETVFRIGLADNEFTKSFKPFKVDALAAPRELLPRSTILYVGAVVDPPKLHSVLKSLDSAPGAVATGSGANARDKEIDADIEKLIVPNMQGEMAAALVSLKPIFNGAEWPAMALALKLKNGELAEAHRAGKLFANFKRAPNATALGSPITALGEDDDAPFVAVTNDYFILADSVETLKMFEAKEKFASSRDFERSTKELPGDLALFATYGLEAALDEASKVVTDSSSQQMLPFISAVIHAFHSQRAYFAVEKDGLTGRLSVSFDREGRYSVGDLANATGDFDLANAMITPKGLTVIQSPRVEAMTMRVTAKQPGVAPRVRDDLAKFNFQRVESSDDSAVVVTSSARHIPEKLTVHLPLTGAEFAPFLNPTSRINSKDPQIVALAKQIAGDDKDGRSVARKIGEWTYKNLKWKKVESDTVDTLASREADCLEHSELYVALARALGLPARVVTGAALSGGSFGAHAWVEIYLGKWVELDPTWGLMDHVDATHLRFDGDAFTSYAMLNQIELEITSARRAVADYQRDPIRLVKEFSLDPVTRDLAFDLSLTVEQSLGQSRWEKLDERQRAAVISAFEKTVNEMWETWKAEIPLQPRALQSDVKADRATITLLRGEALLRFTLARRDGAWFITEHEIVDDALPEFADSIQGALQPGSRRGLVFETSIENAAKHIEKLIAQEGEKPELLLLKSRVLGSQEIEEAAKTQDESETNKTESNKTEPGKTEAGKATSESAKSAKPDQPASDPSVEVLKEIAKRWPDFAPARLALARELLYSGSGEDAVNPLSKDAERAIAELHAYARLTPYDPRPWRDLAFAYEQFEKLEDAESALEKAVELDREYLDHHAALVNFHLTYDNPEKAKPAFARMLKVSSDVDEIFGQFVDEEGYDPDYAKALESLLLAFPKQLEGSGVGWILLAGVQDAQNKIGDAIKSMQRAIAIEPSASSYEVLSRLYRSQRRFTEALNAANQAIKLEEDSVDAHFERACSLAQLGRKREALAALKQMLEIDPETVFDPEEPDLQPLTTMPEFKAMRDKMKEATAPPNETKDETKKTP